MQAYLGTIVCKFGGDPVSCLREEAIYSADRHGQTDTRQTRLTTSQTHGTQQLKAANSAHILQPYLPERPELTYNLRERSHNRSLITKTMDLTLTF